MTINDVDCTNKSNLLHLLVFIKCRVVSRDAESMEKSVFYGFLSFVLVYGQKNDLWPNLRIFSYSVQLQHQISGFFGIPIGQPWVSVL